MKKLITILMFLSLTLVGFGQMLAPKGIKVGNYKAVGTSVITVDSVTQYSTSDIKFWKGATQLNPNVPAAFQTDLASLLALPVAENFLKGLQAMGSDIKAMNLLSGGIALGDMTMADGILYLIPVYVAETITVTGIGLIFRSPQGSYNAANENRIGFYSLAGTTLTLRASCADNGNLWKATAYTYVKTNFSATYVAVRGIYYVGLLFNTSDDDPVAAPTFYANQATSSMLGSVTGTDVKVIGSIAAQATLPASLEFSTVSNEPTNPTVIVY